MTYVKPEIKSYSVEELSNLIKLCASGCSCYCQNDHSNYSDGLKA